MEGEGVRVSPKTYEVGSVLFHCLSSVTLTCQFINECKSGWLLDCCGSSTVTVIWLVIIALQSFATGECIAVICHWFALQSFAIVFALQSFAIG